MEITTRCCGNCAHAKHLYDNIAHCQSVYAAKVEIDNPVFGSQCSKYEPKSRAVEKQLQIEGESMLCAATNTINSILGATACVEIPTPLAFYAGLTMLQKRVRELEVEAAKVPLLKQLITGLEARIEQMQIEAALVRSRVEGTGSPSSVTY